MSVTIANTQNQSIENDLRDSEIRIELNDLFLGISGRTPDYKYSDNIASYRVGTSSSASGDIMASFVLQVKSFSNSIFNTYSVKNGTFIRSYMNITGLNSGVFTQKEINIRQQ